MKLLDAEMNVVAEGASIRYDASMRGWMVDDRLFADGDSSLSIARESDKVSPVQFKLLWTAGERVALNRFRQGTEPEYADVRDALNDFFGLLEDPRLTFVDLGLSSTRAGVGSVLALLQTMGVVADVEARQAEILSGAFQ